MRNARFGMFIMVLALVMASCSDQVADVNQEQDGLDVASKGGKHGNKGKHDDDDRKGHDKKDHDRKLQFFAKLDGEQAGTDSRGRGILQMKVSKDGESVSFKVNISRIENVTVAHIHLQPEGAADGPPVVWLYPSAPPPVLIPGPFNGTLAEGTFTAANLVGPLAGMTIDDLVEMIKANRTYINVHTTLHPAGEIRGQINRGSAFKW